MDVHGVPSDIDLDAVVKEASLVSDETSAWIMSLLTKKASELPKRPGTFDNPRLKDILQHEREMWDFEYQLMQEALEDGGELWRWSTPFGNPELKAGACGFAVVKDGRVTAVTMVAIS
jgi:hypothetical protein